MSESCLSEIGSGRASLEADCVKVDRALASDSPQLEDYVTEVAKKHFEDYQGWQKQLREPWLAALFYGGVAVMVITVGRRIASRYTDNRWIVLSTRRTIGYSLPALAATLIGGGIGFAMQRKAHRPLIDGQAECLKKAKELRGALGDRVLDRDEVAALAKKNPMLTAGWVEALTGEK